MDDDAELLRDYATNRSDRAFARLVERHIDLVYSAALRRTGGDPHRAAEVTQMVFIDLARKAATLARHPVLTGWLHQSTRWAANNLRRSEQRRATHERAAATELLAAADDPPLQAVEWDMLRPLLDDALDELRDADREAVLLRYFNNCSFAEVGRQLGTGESAARMRVERALEKLHGILRRKGLAGGAVALGAAMAKNAVAAAPVGLVAAVTPAATAAGSTVAGAAVGGGVVLMSKVAMALVGAGVVTLAVLCLQQQQTLAAERDAVARARERHAVRQAEVVCIATQVERLQTALARLPSAADVPPPNTVEMERKRLDMVIRKGEVDYSYAPLFRRMKLSRVQVDTFKTFIVERNQALYDAGQLLKEQGVSLETLAEAEEFRREATRGVDAQIAGVIGLENARLFADMQRPWGSIGMFNPAGEDQRDEDSLWARAKALGDLADRTCRDTDERAFAQNTVLPFPQAFLDGAKAIVSEAEYRELLDDNERIRIRARMIELERAAAYAGKLKLAKGSARDYAPAKSTP